MSDQPYQGPVRCQVCNVSVSAAEGVPVAVTHQRGKGPTLVMHLRFHQRCARLLCGELSRHFERGPLKP